MADYYVEVRNLQTEEVIKRLGPMSERKAERVERGMLINMNHEDYYTQITIDPHTENGNTVGRVEVKE